MQICTITHNADGVRINRDGETRRFANVVELAEAFADLDASNDLMELDRHKARRQLAEISKVLAEEELPPTSLELKRRIEAALDEIPF